MVENQDLYPFWTAVAWTLVVVGGTSTLSTATSPANRTFVGCCADAGPGMASGIPADTTSVITSSTTRGNLTMPRPRMCLRVLRSSSWVRPPYLPGGPAGPPGSSRYQAGETPHRDLRHLPPRRTPRPLDAAPARSLALARRRFFGKCPAGQPSEQDEVRLANARGITPVQDNETTGAPDDRTRTFPRGRAAPCRGRRTTRRGVGAQHSHCPGARHPRARRRHRASRRHRPPALVRGHGHAARRRLDGPHRQAEQPRDHGRAP